MSQQEAESEGVQPNHNNSMPSIEPGQSHFSRSQGEPNVNPGTQSEDQFDIRVQPNHNNNSMPNSISEFHRFPSNLGGSEIELDVSLTHQNHTMLQQVENGDRVLGWLTRLLWKAITQLATSSNQGGSAPQPQLSEAQFLANELWRRLVQPDTGGLSRGVQPDFEPGQSQLAPSQGEPNVNPGTQSQDIEPAQSQLPRSQGEPNVNPGTQSEDQFYSRTADLNHYRPLYKAAQSGDWKAAKRFINDDQNALTAKIDLTGKTVLHVAACCWQWEFVLKLLELIISPQSIADLAVKTESGKTVLHYVVQGGSLKTAKALVQKNSYLPQIKDKAGYLPLFHSIASRNKELVWYLSSKVDYPTEPFFETPSLPRILRYLIISGYHDIALYFVKKYSRLAMEMVDGESLLYWLATNPSSFFSGSNLGFLERWIYKFVHVEIRNSQPHLVMVNMEDIPESILEGFTTLQRRSFVTQVLRWFNRLLWKTIAQLDAALSVKKVRDAKLKHECAVELVNHVCAQLSCRSFQEIHDFLLTPKSIMASAVIGGIEEIVETLFLNFPDLIDNPQLMPESPKRNILQTAIEYRQVKIVNIVKKFFPGRTKSMGSHRKELENTTLHLAGELAPPLKLLSVSGAALQMQRELQWFKEVEEIAFLDQRERKNKDDETPKEVFRTKHKALAEQGEKWMKDTANSCMLVSTLIATVLFAAAFTVPGGNINDKGIPIFLRMSAFAVFTISDALGLFSSLTSLLMFLAILTARYEIDDFLESLPKKLIIGLGSLFFAIAAMITTFGAALTIILSERWHWVSMPITLVAFVPVVMFVWLQLPLFVQMVQSTYGASLFRPWPSRKFE